MVAAVGGATGQGLGAHGGKMEEKEWILLTKTSFLVKDMKIKSLEEIYLFLFVHHRV
jgi:hypothetical protein